MKRKYLIKYTYEAWVDKKVTHQEYLEGVACYGLKEYKIVIGELKSKIGTKYLDNEVTVLSGDGNNADTIRVKYINNGGALNAL
jgi:hypothetical protein